MAFRQHLTNVILLAALTAGSLALVFTRDAPKTTELKEREGRTLQLFRPEALTELNVERDGAKFRLFRASQEADAGPEGRAWKIEQDGKIESADALAISRALGSLEHSSPERTIAPGEVNRAQFGLETPRLRVTLTMGQLRTTFALGGPAARPEGAVYVDDNGAVRVVKASAFDYFDQPADSYRSRSVVPYLSNELKQMRFSGSEGEVNLERLAGVSWRLATGDLAGTRVDRFLLERLLSSFPDLKADHFLAEAEAQQAQQGAPSVKVVMTPEASGKPVGEFTIGGPCPGHPDEVVVIRKAPRPLFACSAKGNLDLLQRPAAQFADTRAFSLRDDEIEEVLMEQGDKKLEIARKGNGWRQRQPVEADVAADQAKALVKALGTTKGEQIERKAPEGFEVVARVTARGPRENEEARPAEPVELGKPGKDGSVYLHRTQDGAYLRLDRDQARPFFPRATALRSTQLINHAIDRARSIRISQGGALLQHLERKDGSWQLTAPRGFAADISTAAELAENLLHLSADQWVADRDDGSFGLENPRFRAEVAVDEGDAGAKTYALLLGEVGASGVYGRIEGIEGVFLVPRALEQTLASLAIDQSAFAVSIDDIEQVTFKRPEGTLTLAAKNGKLLPPQGAEIPASRLDALKSALADLRAQAALHTGKARKEEGLEKPSLEISVKRAQGKELKIAVGAADVLKNSSIYYARIEGTDATFAIASARVRAITSQL